MIFELDTTIVTLQEPAQWPYPTGFKLSQATEKSASGVPHVEDFDVRTGTFTYHFEEMPDADYLAVVDFFLNIAVAMMNNFYLTDDLGVRRLVHFVEDNIQFQQTYLDQWAGYFIVEEVV